MLHTVLLGVHIAAGTSGLLLGPLALAVPQRAGWHPRLGVAYQGGVAVMTQARWVWSGWPRAGCGGWG